MKLFLFQQQVEKNHVNILNGKSWKITAMFKRKKTQKTKQQQQKKPHLFISLDLNHFCNTTQELHFVLISVFST